MRTLHLALRAEYFNAIKAGQKTEEYRLVSEHWFQRLAGRTFDQIVLTLGYPKRDDESRRMVFPWNGYEMKEITHKHFGDKPVLVYAIKLEASK